VFFLNDNNILCYKVNNDVMDYYANATLFDFKVII